MFKNKKRKSKKIIAIQAISSIAGLTAIASVPATYFGYSAYKDKSAAIANSKKPIESGPWAPRIERADEKTQRFPDIERNYVNGNLVNDALSKEKFDNVTKALKNAGVNSDDKLAFNKYFFNNDKTITEESNKFTPEIFYDFVKANTLIYDNFSKQMFDDVQQLIKITHSKDIKPDAQGNYGKIVDLNVQTKNVWYQDPSYFNFDTKFTLKFSGQALIGPITGMLEIEFKPTTSSRLFLDDNGNVSLTRTLINLAVELSVDNRLWTAFVYTNLDPKKPFSEDAPVPYNNWRSALLYNWTNDGNQFDTLQSIPGMPLFAPLYAKINDSNGSKGYIKDYFNWLFEVLLNYINSPNAFDLPKAVKSK